MRQAKTFLIILLVLITSTVNAQTCKIKVENIDDSAEEFHSCGKRLGFDRKNQTGYIFFYTGERTVMLIDDELIELALVSSDDSDNTAIEKGKNFTEVYLAKGIKVVIDHIVSGDSDNTLQFEGVLKITKGENKRRIKFTGWSGC